MIRILWRLTASIILCFEAAEKVLARLRAYYTAYEGGSICYENRLIHCISICMHFNYFIKGLLLC